MPRPPRRRASTPRRSICASSFPAPNWRHSLEERPTKAPRRAGPACIYTIDPGDGTAELYSASVSSPDLIQPIVDYVRQYEEAEWLEGLGDAAYLQPADFGEGFGLTVLVVGKYGVSISGPRSEVLKEAARVILERLGG